MRLSVDCRSAGSPLYSDHGPRKPLPSVKVPRISVREVADRTSASAMSGRAWRQNHGRPANNLTVGRAAISTNLAKRLLQNAAMPELTPLPALSGGAGCAGEARRDMPQRR